MLLKSLMGMLKSLMWISSTYYDRLKQSEKKRCQNMHSEVFHEYCAHRRRLECQKIPFRNPTILVLSSLVQDWILTIYNQCHGHSFVGSWVMLYSYLDHRCQHTTPKSLLLKFQLMTICCNCCCLESKILLLHVCSYQEITYRVLCLWFCQDLIVVVELLEEFVHT